MSEPDEVNGADKRPSRSSGLTLVGLLGGAVAAAVLLGELTAPDPPPRPTTAAAPTHASNLPTTPEPDKSTRRDSSTRCPVPMGALTLGDHPRVRAKAIEHWDCAALAQGPWSVVIRASDGHPGVRGAVVTFPYTWDPQTPQTPLSKPRGATWNAEYRMLTWPLADSHAYIVGDLGQATLADLAARVTVENGRPHFLPLDGFTAVAATTSRAWVIHEMLYDTVDLGQVGALGNGQVRTGVLRGVGDQGGGSLIWESAPGELTYISFAGSASEAKAINALRALADKGTVLTPTQWWNLDRAQGGPPGSLQGEAQGQFQ